VGVGPDRLERAQALVDAGVDLIVIQWQRELATLSTIYSAKIMATQFTWCKNLVGTTF
jgi:hypothetical protein